MWVSRFFVWFVVYSCMGWLYETLYCTVKSGKWANRGFLYGPMCPIYGVGALGISAVYEHLRWEGGGDPAWWQIFVIAVLGSVVLEYSTSWLLEKMFHAYWWDYSDSPLNINGRVCLPASLAFGVAGLVVVYLVYPVVHRMTAGLTGPARELVSLILMAYMAADATLTVSALTGLEENVAAVEESVNRQMEVFVGAFQEKLAGTIQGTKQSVEERITEARELATADRLERMLGGMSRGQRRALERVKGFRPKKATVQIERLADLIKRNMRLK